MKAQNLRTRIERIEKEYEKYAIYQSVDLQEIDQTQKRMAAKAQINGRWKNTAALRRRWSIASRS